MWFICKELGIVGKGRQNKSCVEVWQKGQQDKQNITDKATIVLHSDPDIRSLVNRFGNETNWLSLPTCLFVSTSRMSIMLIWMFLCVFLYLPTRRDTVSQPGRPVHM